MGALVAVISKKGENAVDTALVMLKAVNFKNVDAYGVATSANVKIEETVDALQPGLNSPIIIGYAFTKILEADKPQPVKIEDAAVVFEGRFYPPQKEGSGAEAFAAKMLQDREKAIESIMMEAEGDFAFVLAEAGGITAGRDVIGMRPLYYGENEELVALASQRTAIWHVGISSVNSFPPGYVARVNETGIRLKPIKMLIYPKQIQQTIQIAADNLRKLLQKSIKERVAGLKDVAIAFSGGLDSSLIALLTKKTGVSAHLIYVTLENQQETKYAKSVAEELNLPIHIHCCKEKDLEETLTKVLRLIEEPNPVDASIGIPVYWTAEKTAERNLKVMLAGQGADELFGGYKRYADYYLKHGAEKTRKAMFTDIVKIHEINLERDYKLCNSHGIELRLPFATYQIAKFAAELPTELKIKLPDDGLRKLVLRHVAENLGLPQVAVEKPKKAIQYTTGICNALKRAARKKRLTLREFVKERFEATFKEDKI